MANVQIKDLTPAASAAISDKLAVDNASDQSRYVTMSQVRDLIQDQIEAIQFDTSYTAGAHSEGLVYWDSAAKTIAAMTDIEDVILQIGQEMYVKVHNDTGDTIANGTPVYITGVSGGMPTVALAQADDIATSVILGVATEDVADSAAGYVTTFGIVRDIDTSAFSAGDSLYLDESTAGEYTTTKPDTSTGNVVVYIAQVLSSNATTGAILVNPIVPSITFVYTPVCFSEFLETNTKNLDQQMHGGFTQVVDGESLASGDPITFTHGLGKVLIVVKAGTTSSGTLTITGTTVDRNTGIETPADTNDITLTGVTTDGSTTDAEGNTRHAFTKAYISSNWFKGSITITTADLDLSEVDIYNVSFEQVNDTPDMTLETLDASLYATNNSAWFYGYLYVLDVDSTAKTCNLIRQASLELPAGDTAADRRYRLRKGLLNYAMNGTSDGFWVELFFGPGSLSYFTDINIKVWFTLKTYLQ